MVFPLLISTVCRPSSHVSNPCQKPGPSVLQEVVNTILCSWTDAVWTAESRNKQLYKDKQLICTKPCANHYFRKVEYRPALKENPSLSLLKGQAVAMITVALCFAEQKKKETSSSLTGLDHIMYNLNFLKQFPHRTLWTYWHVKDRILWSDWKFNLLWGLYWAGLSLHSEFVPRTNYMYKKH